MMLLIKCTKPNNSHIPVLLFLSRQVSEDQVKFIKGHTVSKE